MKKNNLIHKALKLLTKKLTLPLNVKIIVSKKAFKLIGDLAISQG